MSLFGKILKVGLGAGVGFLTGGPAGALAGGASGLAGAIQKNGTNKAVGAQTAGAQTITDLANANRSEIFGMNAPTVAAGNTAIGAIGGFLGGVGGLDAYRKSTGYEDLLKTGLGAVNASAYARGAGDSGAALKALQAKGMNIADQSSQGWLNNQFNLAQAGTQARSIDANTGNFTVGALADATKYGADAQSNGALVNAGNDSSYLSQLASMGVDALKQRGSSYTPTQGYNNALPAWLNKTPPLNVTPGSLGSWARL